MKTIVVLATVCAAGWGICGSSERLFRWEPEDAGERNSWICTSIPDSQVYSVRFDAAILRGTANRWFSVIIDGTEFRSNGTGFTPQGVKDTAHRDIQFRDRCFHELVVVSSPTQVRFFADGDEYKPFDRQLPKERGFSFVSEGASAEVRGFSIAAGDCSGTWASRNLVVNGGFEELCNGFPVGWGTGGYGILGTKYAADPDSFRRTLHVDSTTAVEGRNSLFLSNDRADSYGEVFECWRNRLPKTDYVLSAWLKTDVPGTDVELMTIENYDYVASIRVKPSAEWRRFEFPFTSKTGGSLRCGVKVMGLGRVWIDAVQIERGTKATEYAFRPLHRLRPPENPPKVMDHYYSDRTVPVPPKDPPRMASVNPVRNSLMIDGKEFFMFGFTTGQLSCRDTTAFARFMDAYARHGFNMIQIDSKEMPTNASGWRTVLDICESRGVKMGIYLQHQQMVVAEGLFDILKAVGDHPGLLFVDLFDECMNNVTPEQRRRTADRVREVTGGRIPVKFNEFDAGVLGKIDHSSADISSYDMYFVGGHDLSAIYYLLKQHKDANTDRVVMFYQEASGHFGWQNMRDPTPEEVLVQAYIGFVQEIFNQGWWIVSPLTPDVMPAVAQAKREMDVINPSNFLDGAPYGLLCQSPNDAVKFAARHRNGKATVIVVNIESRPNTAVWTLPAEVKSIHAVIGTDPGRLDGRMFTDTFAPHERRVYEIEL